VQLYGEALRRIIEDVRAHPDITEALTRDELVSHVLILHDLHPTLQLGVEAEKPSPDPKFISLLPGGVIV
jgi:hypothetical protein